LWRLLTRRSWPTHQIESRRSESRVDFWLKFILHQCIGMWGTTFSAGVVTGLAFDILMRFGKTYTRSYFYWILSGRPYFPIQITLAALLGWVFGRYLWHRSMVWVWVLPLAYLCYAFAAVPTFTPNLPPEFQAGVGESRFSHYFGWGCGPWNHCLDQTAVTVPFYVAVSYSIGALLAHKLSERIRLNGRAESGAIFVFGMWFFVAAVCDLYFSTRGGGWHWMFLPIATVPAGIGAYLVLLALTMWWVGSTPTAEPNSKQGPI